MKHTIFLILLLAVGSYAQTLDETLSYLNDKLPTEGTIRVSKVMSFTIAPVSFAGCTVSYTESYTLNSENHPFSTTKVTIPLRSLTATAQASDKYKPFWQVDLAAPIQLQSLKYGQLPGAVMERTSQPLLVKDQDSAGKIVRAFTNASTLCREQQDLFAKPGQK